jgi:parallel beta-helix repeat protein
MPCVFIYPDNVAAGPGENITVTVAVFNLTDNVYSSFQEWNLGEPLPPYNPLGIHKYPLGFLVGFHVKISWDPNILEYLNHAVTIPVEDYPDPIPPLNFTGTLHQPILPVIDEVDAELGTYELAKATYAFHNVNYFNGNGTLFKMAFHVRKEGYSQLTITVSKLAAPRASAIGKTYTKWIIPHEVRNGLFRTFSQTHRVHNLNTGLNYTTIQEAIDAASPEDIIYAENGTYFENIVVDRSLTLIGENKTATFIDGCGVENVTRIAADNIVLENFTIMNSGNYPNSGILLDSIHNSIIFNNVITDNYYGITVSSSSHILFDENVIKSNNQGIWIHDSANTTLFKNNVTANTHAIRINRSPNNVLNENYIAGNQYGSIELFDSSFNNIYGNSISTSMGDAVWLSSSFNNTISANTMKDIEGDGILLSSSSNNTIKANFIANTYDGIYFYESDDNDVIGNNVTADSYGIWIWSSSNNLMLRNKVTTNLDSGILLMLDSPSNRIVENYIFNISSAPAIVAYSSNNTIIGNNVVNNAWSIGMTSANNTILHNNFINNQFKPIAPADSLNYWDNGFEGNYWSDYDGTDSNHDGIGDTPYEINANNIDYYPLMGIFQSFNTLFGYVTVVSNSTVEDFEYSESTNTIIMHVSNMTTNQTYGFCRISIPHALMNETYHVTINGADPCYCNYTLYDDGHNRWIYFSYQHSTLEVIIVPEFPPSLIVPTFLIITLLAVMVYRKNIEVKKITNP